MSSYRAEIDGMRAVAVIPVIFFHAGFEAFSGGYVGVDVFFVISGYLITSIILNDIQKKTFSLKHFYERRARRILPALLVMMAFSLLLGWFIMLPESLENLGQSVLATSMFANNVLLWLTSGYWAVATDYKPLVHTWSLGVEEQFYFLWPLLLIYFATKGHRSLIALSLAILAPSLFVSHIGSTEFPEANFYLLPSRAWELMIGALCAIWRSESYGVMSTALPDRLQHRLTNRGLGILSEVASFVGLIIVGVAIFAFDENTPFPSLATLLPVCGACLIILFGDKSLVTGRILSNQWLVWLGLISYSTYLWHQPIFAFARLWSFEGPSPTAFGMLSMLSVILGAVSWRWVERPFRQSGGVSLKYLCILSIGGTALLGAIALFYVLSVGYAPRVFPGVSVVQRENMHIDYNMRVFENSVDRWSENDNPRVLVLGDSFGRDVVNILLESGNQSSQIVYGLDRLDICNQLGSRKLSARLDRLEKSADLVLLASSGYDSECWDKDFMRLNGLGVSEIAVIGPKSFGNSLDAFLRVPVKERPSARVTPTKEVISANAEWKQNIPPANYVDLFSLAGDKDGMPVFTSSGALISQDGRHLTKDGARYFSEIFKNEGLINRWFGGNTLTEQR